MSTIISEVMEKILEEAGIAKTPYEQEARRILERNQRQRDLDRKYRDWDEAA